MMSTICLFRVSTASGSSLKHHSAKAIAPVVPVRSGPLCSVVTRHTCLSTLLTVGSVIFSKYTGMFCPLIPRNSSTATFGKAFRQCASVPAYSSQVSRCMGAYFSCACRGESRPRRANRKRFIGQRSEMEYTDAL